MNPTSHRIRTVSAVTALLAAVGEDAGGDDEITIAVTRDAAGNVAVGSRAVSLRLPR